MPPRSFLDTNVLLYAEDSRAPEKRRIADDLLAALSRAGAAVVSTQVLQEFYSVATRRLGVPSGAAQARVEILSRLSVVQLNPTLILAAIERSRLHGLNFWDAPIVEAARAGGCAILYSEDMQAGRRFGALEVVNPFA